MRVELLTPRIDAGEFQPAGSIVEVDPEVARRMIERMDARPVAQPPDTAMVGPPLHNAARPRGRPRKPISRKEPE